MQHKAIDTPPIMVTGGTATIAQPSPDVLVLKPVGLRILGIGFLVLPGLFLFFLSKEYLTTHVNPAKWWFWVLPFIFITIGLFLFGRSKTVRFERLTKTMKYGEQLQPWSNIISVQVISGGIPTASSYGEVFQLNLVLRSNPEPRLNLAVQRDYTSALLMARQLADFLQVPLTEK